MIAIIWGLTVKRARIHSFVHSSLNRESKLMAVKIHFFVVLAVLFIPVSLGDVADIPRTTLTQNGPTISFHYW